jgi:type IV secretion system protein VirB3
VALARYTVHRALTRPQMFAGVTYSYFIINAAVTTELFLITIACLREPRVFDLWIAKVSKCPRVPNWARWGCNSYAP